MKAKALRKQGMHDKTEASVLLKLFISGNERCHTTDAPYRMSRTLFSSVNKHTINDPWGPEKYNYTMISTERHFTAATQALIIPYFTTHYIVFIRYT